MTNLSSDGKTESGGASNCYIVNPDSPNEAGYSFITTVAGNGVTVGWEDIHFTDGITEAYPTGGCASISGNSVAVVYNKRRYNLDQPVIKDVIYSNGKVYFRTTGREGNAKITLLSDNSGVLGDSNGVWTWHIWCTDQPAEKTINGYQVLDRNIGAVTNIWVGSSEEEEMYGFFYPFGHYMGFPYEVYYSNGDEGGWRMIDTYAFHPEKPYVKIGSGSYVPFGSGGADGASGSISPNVWNRIWKKPLAAGNKGSTKTMYDPCPFGYTVMYDDVLSGYSNSTYTGGEGNLTTDAEFCANYYGMIINHCFFPYNGKVYRGTNYSTRGVACYLWTNSYSSSDRSVCYTIHKSTSDANKAIEGGLSIDYIGIGKSVRCMKEVWE